jgi:alpha-beta hydrolase superfamily lysophospholipase
MTRSRPRLLSIMALHEEDAVVAETMPSGMLPIVFGPPDRPLLGFYHAPDGPPTRSIAVVLCNPIGFEALSAHRTYRHLAERLAAKGVPALRFDYDGTGDSSGRSDDPDRMNAWLGSIAAALHEIRSRSGVRQVALFGVRFGATLAMLAAAEDGRVDAMISWAPVISGRAHVGELRAFRMLTPRTPVPKRTDGGEEVGGYFFAGETLAAISNVDLLRISDRSPRRVLVLPRSERAAADEARLTERLKAQGAEVLASPAPGFSGMMREDPYETVVPVDTLDRIVEWLCQERQLERRSASQDARLEGATSPRSSAGVVKVTARNGKLAVTETPLLFGPGARLFGVLSEPEGPAPRDRPALCFLNVGANTHVGPHRMNVELAREFASRGYLAFRFDAAGLGESLAAPGARENRIYTKDSVADVEAAMTLLEKTRHASRFVLVGLCSGAYLAFHATIKDPRVAGQILLSSYAFEWQEGDPVAPKMREPFRSTRFYARALLDHDVWLRALRGDVAVRRIAGALLERLEADLDARLPSWSARLLGQRAFQNEVERAFVAISDRGTDSLLVSSFDDGGVDMVTRYLGTDARKMRGRSNFSFRVVEGADHTFKTLASQRMLRETLADHVTTLFP